MARWSIPALLVVMGLGMALSPACARPEPPAVAVPATDGKGRIGIRFQPLPEGLLVLEVAPGTGAALAGIAVGDLILAADGQALAERADDEMVLAAVVRQMRVVGRAQGRDDARHTGPGTIVFLRA